MVKQHFSLIIIGTGLAGYMTAKEWRRLVPDQPLLMITQDDGAFYSKPQLSNALMQNKSAADLMMSSVEKMREQLSAEIITHTSVDSIDAKNKQIFINETVFSYDQLVLACGAHANLLRLATEIPAPAMLSINSLTDYAHFREWLNNKKHITIIGSGLVGCEFADELSRTGYQVDLVSADAYPLARWVPQAIGKALQQRLQQNGVQWHFHRRPTQITAHANQFKIEIMNGEAIKTDGILTAIGITPNIALAQAAHLACNRGIVVDHYLQTSAPGIFALGDCVELNGQVQPYVAPILQGSRALAATLAGKPTPVTYPPMPIVLKTPSYPLVILPPLNPVGEWTCDLAQNRALFHDEAQKLQGFVLANEAIRDKLNLLKQLNN